MAGRLVDGGRHEQASWLGRVLSPQSMRRVSPAAHSLSSARVRPSLFTAGPSGPARRRCALDDREEILTASPWWLSNRPDAGWLRLLAWVMPTRLSPSGSTPM